MNLPRQKHFETPGKRDQGCHEGQRLMWLPHRIRAMALCGASVPSRELISMEAKRVSFWLWCLKKRPPDKTTQEGSPKNGMFICFKCQLRPAESTANRRAYSHHVAVHVLTCLGLCIRGHPCGCLLVDSKRNCPPREREVLHRTTYVCFHQVSSPPEVPSFQQYSPLEKDSCPLP